MRFLRLMWTLIGALFGSQASAERLRHGMAMRDALDSVMMPYRRGDYEAALQAAEGFRLDGDISAAYCFYRGACLAQLERLPEAETWLRRNIALRRENESRFLAIAYTTLGHLMLQAGRPGEAVDCFETSIKYFPGRSSGYRSMAEAVLMRGGDSCEALRWAKRAIEKEKADRQTTPELRQLNLGECTATLAWAVAAASHDASEVARLVTEGVALVGTGSLSSTAQVHYLSGRAYEELGDAAQSAHHYGEAAKLDRQGAWGRAARAAIGSGAVEGGPLPAAR
jgi:tetratricopeptide (TPR) repeat protein